MDLRACAADAWQSLDCQAEGPGAIAVLKPSRAFIYARKDHET